MENVVLESMSQVGRSQEGGSCQMSGLECNYCAK